MYWYLKNSPNKTISQKNFDVISQNFVKESTTKCHGTPRN
jgi:hypothetical protein